MVLVAKSKKVRRGRRIVIAMTVMLILLVMAAGALFVMLGYYVDSLNTVYPNVWYEGINMSGLTKEQARQVLINNGYEERAAQISVTVSLPFDISYSLNGDDVGLTLNAEEAAEAIVEYGRDGSILTNEMSYIGAFFGKIELQELSRPNYDNTAMRRLAVEHAAVFNETLTDSEVEITGTSIKLTKGTNFAPVSADELLSFTEVEFERAMEQNGHVDASFLPEADYTTEMIDIQAIFDEINVEPVSSYYDPVLGDPNSEIYDPINKGATESVIGKTFDLEAVQEQYDALANGDTLIVPITIMQPEVLQSDLAAMLYRDVLAEADVSAASNSNRAENVTLASSTIGVYTMQPGDIFSYNEVVGQRTAERGYKPAPAYISGEREETTGGGICQVSSAIHYTLLLTDLEFVERQAHGMEVSYLKGGLDATVSWGTIDFKFRNNMDLPIRLEVSATGSVSVNVKIVGTRVSDVYYRVESQHIGTTEMEEIHRIATEEEIAKYSIAPQEERVINSGNRGTSYRVWRYHYTDPDLENPVLDTNGEPYRELIRTTTYGMKPRVTVVNAHSASAPPPPVEQPPGDSGEA